MTGKAGPEWLTDGYRHIWMPYTQMQTAPLPLAVAATQGSRIILADGRELIDGIASWWSACHGYNHPHILDAVEKQLRVMPHVMLAGLANQPAFRLAERLTEMAPGDLSRVFFSESGSVAVEVAMKMAVQYWRNKGDAGRTRFVCFQNAYHGDTFATMALGDPGNVVHGPFQGTMPEQFLAALPEDAGTKAGLEDLLGAHAEECAAVILEPMVQGAGGMKFHSAATVKAVREACDRFGLLLIADEIMVGLGRLGSLFACDQAAIVPDIMTLSKSLTGGTLPLAATIATGKVFQAFQSDRLEDCLMHGPTFTGHALAAAAANASLDLFASEARLAQVSAIADHMAKALAPCAEFPGVTDVRVAGAIGVVELDDLGDFTWIREAFIAAGCWLRPFGNVIYLMPAFTIGEEDLAALTATVVTVTRAWSQRREAA